MFLHRVCVIPRIKRDKLRMTGIKYKDYREMHMDFFLSFYTRHKDYLECRMVDRGKTNIAAQVIT